MKRHNLILIGITLLLVLASASASLAVFPIPDDCKTFKMFQGWFDGNLAWYICTDTNNIRQAQTQNITLAFELESAYKKTAPVYIVTNPTATPVPIFSTRPGDRCYSGIWTVYFVTWVKLYAREPLTSEKQILWLAKKGDLKICPSNPHLVVDYPIVALGRLGGPWLQKPDPPFYRIPQGITHDPYNKTITLPIFNVFCDNRVSRLPKIAQVVITDVGDPGLAFDLKANLAPGLFAIPSKDTQRFWVIGSPKPPSQLPVIEDCPDFLTWRNSNRYYSPVMKFIKLFRKGVEPSTVVNNDTYLLTLINNGLFKPNWWITRINAPVVCM